MPESRSIPFPLFVGLTVASIGGPLALVALNIPAALGRAGTSAGLTVLIGTLAFVFPVLIWQRYSERIASNGGLYAFVEAATGPTLARVQAGFWITSYFLYLVYTVPYIVYDLLPVVFPSISRNQLLIDGALAVSVAVVMVSPRIVALSILVAIAGVQALVAMGLAVMTLVHLGTPAGSFVGHGNLAAILSGAGQTSSFYICASLPLFLGGEVRGGTRSVQQALAWAFPAVGLLAVIAVFPLANAAGTILASDIPGVSLAQIYSGPTFGTAVGLGVAVSSAGLIIAEFLALSRLLGTMFNQPSRSMVIVISALFLAASLLSLINPPGVYRLLLKPSLIALWIAQLLVVAAYPWFVARHRRLGSGDIGLAAAASLLMLFALYTSVTTAYGT